MDRLTLQDLGEDEVISRLTQTLAQGQSVLEGVGDDCAVVLGPPEGHAQLLKTDAVVEGIHFTEVEDPCRVGWKALARVVSDIASMGGTPDCALITLVAPKDTLFSRVSGLYQGLKSCADRFGISIVGGETTSGPRLLLSVMLTGHVPQQAWIPRAGAKAGDAIFVTGVLGGSIEGHHLDFVPRLEEAHWLVAEGPPSAMMELSDGLAKDLPRLAKASKQGFRLDASSVPCREGFTFKQALQDGEDYELLFTLPQSHVETLTTRWKARFPETRLTQIGEILAPQDPSATDPNTLQGGWDHYAQQSC